MRYLDQLYAVYYDAEKSQTLFNRAAVRIHNPAARQLLCALRDQDMELVDRLQREIATVEYKNQATSIFLPDLGD
ncbi:MAG: hypothetical protein M0Z41_01755 [Peptococcaceae bacterium]|jgi:hypothetical protein|nr:hypothetical protein [Peptococcaceae bacterium]